MMKISKAPIITCFLLCFLCTTKAQTITINFKDATKYGSHPNPHYFDNSGCGLYNRFGPNPTPLNGYNIRTVGNTWISDASTIIAAINMYASGKKNSNYNNSTISVEYPFKANKTYKVELNGIKDDQVWMGGTTRPSNFLTPVLWLKLDNNPEIISNAQNKCIESHYEVEKKVGRYSILIADENKSIGSRNYTAKFSPLEDRNSIKITYDPSPADPNFQFDGIFRLTNIKITELPYEEIPTRIIATYKNAPRPPRGTPGYDIISEVTSTERGSTPRSITKKFTITPSQWALDTDGNGYSVYLSDLVPDLSISKLSNVIVYGNVTGLPRQPIEQIILPGAFENNNYTYQFLSSGDVVITINNVSNTQPSNKVDFALFYN